jgi:large subunit ribosomal protein L9
LAVKATPGALRQFEHLRKTAEVRRAERQQQYNQVAEQIENLMLAFPVKAGESGKLYGSVTPADIAERLKEQLGLELDRRRIGDRPLRELGVFHVPVRLDASVVSHVRVIIHREGETPAEAEAAFEAAQAEEEAMEAEAAASARAAAEEAEAEEVVGEETTEMDEA